MGQVTPTTRRMEENCEALAVSLQVEQAAQAALNQERANLEKLHKRVQKLELLIEAARRKRARLRRENEALEWANADGLWRRSERITLEEWRNRARFQVTKQSTTNMGGAA